MSPEINEIAEDPCTDFKHQSCIAIASVRSNDLHNRIGTTTGHFDLASEEVPYENEEFVTTRLIKNPFN